MRQEHRYKEGTYYNRDLSWLQFNYRVLLEAADETVPLYERLKFLSIFSSNMDEFFRVRYPVVTAISEMGPKVRRKIEPGSKKVLEQIQEEVEGQLRDYGEILTQQLLPALKAENIHVYYNEKIRSEHVNEVREYFLSRVLSFIQPIFLEEEGERDFIPENGKLYFIVSLRTDKDTYLKYAIVNIPSDKIDRFYCPKPIDGVNYVLFLDDIIRENINYIFPGFEVGGVYTIKLNRDADLEIDDDYSMDVIRKIERQLKKRENGPPSRFLYEEGMPKNIQLFLTSIFGISHDEVFSGGRYHNLKDLAKFPSFGKQLYYDDWPGISLPLFYNGGDIFKAVRGKDILIHLPYHSYDPILAFFNQAAIDPEVEEIYITLYRIASESLIANALISAARNGKKVTVFIELKARFDEENNLAWSKKMNEAGIQIIYGIPDIKVHAKTALVTRKNDSGKHAYAVLSTGNFNELTARYYADHVLFTSNRHITTELFILFHFLQKKLSSRQDEQLTFETLYVSRFNLIERFEEHINKEIKKAKRGNGGRIRIKVNNLEEPYMIDLLRKAAKAGVKVDVMARSICCLIPENENATVKRLVDRYLEHSRLFIFGENDDAIVVIGSADLMTRNLRHRVEVCFPILDISCKTELLNYFDLQWQDHEKVVIINGDMEQHRISAGQGGLPAAQHSIYQYLRGRI
ncbi:MAG TPA: polyphosphate kinase 1 [Flavipsychrobacter sp.]|nr:polyphosphate kinase 1 [Flavipsychrobacter sp.]